MKTCLQCNESKPLDDFYKHADNLDGRCGECKECKKEISKRAYREVLAKRERLGKLILDIRDSAEILVKEMKLNV